MSDLKSFFVRMCDDWLPGAMLPSEIWWLYKKIIESRAEVLIECGRQDGYSTKLLAELLSTHGLRIYSIDFDEDKARLKKIKASLVKYDVECVSGDIHVRVPEILAKTSGKRVAILQDGPKGWEGMATLLAAVVSYSPVLIAQHNLHLGHKSREVFQLLSVGPAFVEYDKTSSEIAEFRLYEIDALKSKLPNREIDHTSLGCMVLDSFNISMARDSMRIVESQMEPWSPFRVAQHWILGNLSYVSRLRAAQRFRLYRFKKR